MLVLGRESSSWDEMANSSRESICSCSNLRQARMRRDNEKPENYNRKLVPVLNLVLVVQSKAP